MRPRRRLELAVVACAAVFLVVLALSFRPGRRPAAGRERGDLPPGPEASGEATTLLEGFDFTESVGGRPLMRIQADRTVGYGPSAGLAPNLYAGEKVELTVYPDDGPPVTVHSDRADYDERTRESRLSGNVRWSDREGSLATTEQIVFRPKTRLLEAPGPVVFSEGGARFTAPSARYDLSERVVRLAGPVVGSGTGAGAFQTLTARQGLYRRDSGAMELEFVDGTSAAGDRLAGDRLELDMAPKGGRVASARVTGNVRGVLAADPSPADAFAAKSERPYAGDRGTVLFDAEGRTRSVALEGTPAMLSEGGRRLTARRIEIGFEAGEAATAAAEGDVRVDFPGGHAVAKQAGLDFGPDGTARNVSLRGAVRVEADGRGGQADRAVEFSARDVWVLTGDAKQAARVDSAGSRLSADTIELDRGRKIVRGEGRARAVFSPDARTKVNRAGFVGDPKKPTFAKADRIVLEDATSVATLSGAATLWQDDSSLFADGITLADADRTVRAEGQVRAVMAPAPAKAAGAAARPASVITASRLLYREADRSARFEGGVGVTRGGWRSTGGESTAWLDKDGQVESVEISGNVRMTDRSVGRSAEADKALDSPRLGKTVLWGSPARVTDSGGNRVAGAILTITDRGRSVEITAPEGGKTETIHRTQKD